MTLGELTKCWICYELEAWKAKQRGENPNIKQLCTPYRSKKGTVLEGLVAWLCSPCKKFQQSERTKRRFCK